MPNLDALPAWATRQRNRLLMRHSDQKIVRWMNHRPLGKMSSGAVVGADDEGHEAASGGLNADNFMKLAGRIGRGR